MIHLLCPGHPECRHEELVGGYPQPIVPKERKKLVRMTKHQEQYLLTQCFDHETEQWILCDDHLADMTKKKLHEIHKTKELLEAKRDLLFSAKSRGLCKSPQTNSFSSHSRTPLNENQQPPSDSLHPLPRSRLKGPEFIFTLDSRVSSSMEELLRILGLVHSLSPLHLSLLVEAQREIRWPSLPAGHVHSVVSVLSPLFYIDLFNFLKSFPLRLSGLILCHPPETLLQLPNFPQSIVCCLVALDKLIFETSKEADPEILKDTVFSTQLFDLTILLLTTEIELLFKLAPLNCAQISPFAVTWWECTGATFWFLNRLLSFDISGQSLMTPVHSFISSFHSHPKLSLFVETPLDVWGLAMHNFCSNQTNAPPGAVQDCALHAMDALFWMFLSTDLTKLVTDSGKSPLSSSMPPKAFLGKVVSTAYGVVHWGRNGENIQQRKLIYHAVRLLVVFLEKDDPYILDSITEYCKDTMENLLSLICTVLERLVLDHSEDFLLTECLRLLGLCCDDSNFKNYLTKKMIVPILLFLSAPPKLLSRSFIIAGQERANLYLFVTCISSLHCHNDALFGRKHRNFFCDVAVNEYNKAADAIAIGHPTEPTVFPAFVKKNLEAIGRHLGDGIREGRENPFVTEEDVSLFEDFVRIFLSRCEKKEKKHPVSYSQSLLFYLPGSQRDRLQFLPKGQSSQESLSLINNTIVSVQFSKLERKRKKKGHVDCEDLTKMLFGVQSTLIRGQHWSKTAPPLPTLSLSTVFPLEEVYKRMVFIIRHETVMGPPTMGHLTIITPSDRQRSEPQKKRRRLESSDIRHENMPLKDK